MIPKIYDCIIIGAGPAGLTAANYLARFKCNIKIIDNNDSRAALIPLSHNLPGFPHGIAGKDFLASLKEQFRQHKGTITSDTVLAIKKNGDHEFTVKGKKTLARAKNIILATGVKDIEPNLPNLKFAIKKGLIRHCIICDGFEVQRQNVAIVCKDKKGIQEALLLHTYTHKITVFTCGNAISLSSREKNLLKNMPITIIASPLKKVITKSKKIISIETIDKNLYFFDSIYSAFGAIHRTELAINLGVKHLKDKCLIVNSHQQTNVSGFYAIGDIASGLNQICVAASQGAIAATHIFNALRKNKN